MELNERLIAACECNAVGRIKDILQEIELKPSDLDKAIALLIRKDFLDSLKLFAEYPTPDNSFLSSAIKSDMTNYLNLAVQFDCPEISKFLIENGMPIEMKDHAAIKSAYVLDLPRMINTILEVYGERLGHYDELLIWASRNNYVSLLKEIIKNKGNTYASNSEALRWACFKGYKEIVALLIEAGSNVLAKNNEAFIGAYLNHNTEIQEMLIKAGSNKDAIIAAYNMNPQHVYPDKPE